MSGQPPPPAPEFDGEEAEPAKPWWQQWWAILGIVAIIALVIWAIVNGSDTDTTDTGSEASPSPSASATSPMPETPSPTAGPTATETATATPTAPTTAPPTEPADGAAEPGEVVEFGDGAQARLNGLTSDVDTSDGSVEPAPGTTVTQLDVEICAGDEPLAIDPLFWSGLLGDDTTARALAGEQSLPAITLLPGGCAAGAVPLELPEGSSLAAVTLADEEQSPVASWTVGGDFDGADLEPLTPTVEPELAELGESVAVEGGHSATVSAIELDVEPSDGLVDVPEGSIVARVDLEVCAGDEAYPVDPLHWYLRVQDNHVAGAAEGSEALPSGDLAPGECVDGDVEFLVPEDSEARSVMWTNPDAEVWAEWDAEEPSDG